MRSSRLSIASNVLLVRLAIGADDGTSRDFAVKGTDLIINLSEKERTSLNLKVAAISGQGAKLTEELPDTVNEWNITQNIPNKLGEGSEAPKRPPLPVKQIAVGIGALVVLAFGWKWYTARQDRQALEAQRNSFPSLNESLHSQGYQLSDSSPDGRIQVWRR